MSMAVITAKRSGARAGACTLHMQQIQTALNATMPAHLGLRLCLNLAAADPAVRRVVLRDPVRLAMGVCRDGGGGRHLHLHRGKRDVCLPAKAGRPEDTAGQPLRGLAGPAGQPSGCGADAGLVGQAELAVSARCVYRWHDTEFVTPTQNLLSNSSMAIINRNQPHRKGHAPL